MTKEQAKDIETIRYFIPNDMKSIPITDQDIQDFLALSERGENKNRVRDRGMDGFNALVQGKRWRGIHMQMWEDGHLDGVTPYAELVSELPESVARFMAKELFRGMDYDLIMSLIENNPYAKQK